MFTPSRFAAFAAVAAIGVTAACAGSDATANEAAVAAPTPTTVPVVVAEAPTTEVPASNAPTVADSAAQTPAPTADAGATPAPTANTGATPAPADVSAAPAPTDAAAPAPDGSTAAAPDGAEGAAPDGAPPGPPPGGATGAQDGTGGPGRGGPAGGGPGGVSPQSVASVDQLNSLVQQAYGDAGLGLQRGHQPVESTLIEVLGISHDEMHVRMDQGQNLDAVASDVGVDPQTLIDALVASWSPAIDNLVSSGEITSAQADQYRAALTEAFTFRVTWNGTDATPTFAGI